MSEGRKGFFGHLVKGLARIRSNIVSDVDPIFSGFSAIDDDFHGKIEEALTMGGLRIQTIIFIVKDLRAKVKEQHIREPEERKEPLVSSIKAQMDLDEGAYKFEYKKSVILVIGVNDVGKTTSIGKLAGRLRDSGHKVTLAVMDISHTAAIEQLTEWAGRAGVDIIAQWEGSDPATVIYDATAAAKSRETDVLICDTAGRFHNEKNLIKEFRKVNRIIDKEYANAYREILVVPGGTTDQNALVRIHQFTEVADIMGIILAEPDGVTKGDTVVAIQSELGLPIKYIGIGEQIDDLQKFSTDDSVNALFNIQRNS